MRNLQILLVRVLIVMIELIFTWLTMSERHEIQTLDTPAVNIRRDTSNGRPYGDTHLAGISSIVWGHVTPSATLEITLTRSGSIIATRTVTADPVGNYAVSVDRLIEDNDIVEVYDGTNLRVVQVPTITFQTNPAARIITGTAPANITHILGGPHSLMVSIGGHTYPITTTTTGEFSIILSDNPYLAGLLGAFNYITPDGHRVYKPVVIVDPLKRGQLEDWRADIILGQPDFSQITFNEVVRNKLFNPGGIYVDRSVHPNRIYVYDAGNNRVLGLSHLGTCAAGGNANQECTVDSDCPGSTCEIEAEKPADIVLGQPSFNTSACNGDNGFQLYPDVPMASAKTLCLLPEYANSVSEAGSAATMDTDHQGNLYVPDFYNNRILRYNTPFTTDNIADYVWGQADFAGITCNRGAGFNRTNARSLCLAPPPGFGDIKAGVAVDATGNLWAADNHNNRVLRFPFVPSLGVPAQEADLVLGQPTFSTLTAGTGLDHMNRPSSVRVDNNGIVYVADSLNNRILVFAPPLSNGMSATQVLSAGELVPSGLELDPRGGLWVNDANGNRFIYLMDGVVQKNVPAREHRAWGGMGIDDDSNLLTAGWDLQQGIHLSAPTYDIDASFLQAQSLGLFNQTGPKGLNGGKGLEVTPEQLIYSDDSRLLYWNNPWNLTNYQPADGVIAAPDFQTRKRWGPYFGRMRADPEGRLWVLNGTLEQANIIYGYPLPLTTETTPIYTLTSPLPLLGGGLLTWTQSLYLGGIEVQSNCDCLWVSDEDNNRVFRIRDVSILPTVDIVLGQLDASGVQCNQGRGREAPSQDSLCHPGGLAFDRVGNLYVSDHNLEFDGNHRLLEFDAGTISDMPPAAVFGIPATRVLGRNGNFTEPNCLPYEQDPLCGPFEPTFDSLDHMIVGFNAYLGPRFPMVYRNPLTNPMPIAALADFQSMPTSARFDQLDNLYILDHNRSRILIYRRREVAIYGAY